MLKAQLRSKIFQLDPAWRNIEDLLTGDFFGTLDYLPRRPFLVDFLSRLCDLNSTVPSLQLDDVDWKRVEFLFWPMRHSQDESAEPDLVIVSNLWVIVVEVKLDSGLGKRQPWREYLIGGEIARDNGVDADSVYYVALARSRLDVGATFESSKAGDRDELLARTYYLQWSDVVSVLENWLRGGVNGKPLADEHERMLEDLLACIRRRRALAFSGFAFVNQEDVAGLAGGVFCPPAFVGFLHRIDKLAVSISPAVFLSSCRGFLESSPKVSLVSGNYFSPPAFAGFLTKCAETPVSIEARIVPVRFDGFLTGVPNTACASGGVLAISRFAGFLLHAKPTPAKSERLFAPARFSGFLRSVHPCNAQRTLIS